MNPYVNWSACAHGLDAAQMELHRDDANDALFIYLDGRRDMSIRIDFKDPPDALRRDSEGLRRLQEIAAEADAEIAQRLAGGAS